NIVVAANAGGAFSPFGDITTLMVWQSGKVGFFDFFHIFLPALVSWLVPAFAMMWAIPTLKPRRVSGKVELRFGAEMMCFLFLAAIVFAVCFHNFLHLPPAMGMMFGLALHGFYSYRVQLHEGRPGRYEGILGAVSDGPHSFIREVSDSDEALEQIVDRGCVPAFAIDKNHTVTHWNTALKDLTGISPEDLIGSSKHWTPFYKEERAILADMVVDQVPIEEAAKHYHGQLRENAGIEQAYDAVSYFPNIGDGKWLTFTALPVRNDEGDVVGAVELIREVSEFERERARFDLMRTISRAEWDTLLFFYGVILSVGGLALFGFLEAASHALYSGFGATMANSFVGLISSVLDNIPVMFAVLTMDPSMSVGQWLLVTLTAGVGGSMLAVGSAAGVALLGTAHGQYTFMSHLKWTPVILLGYAASILCHLLINSVMM
ncbi:MAG: sodium:proton antiporter NhaD, partial [Bdellovibrionales bacterium]|nr:sodium:proton antiporter NhaD [Bdellovibrionales bacterium]